MIGRKFYEGPQALPHLIPVFPLAGALLLPGARLPLNIFEPRYLAMVDDALKSFRLIGMIQPESPSEAERTTPKLAEVGCVGRLTQFAETQDGRYLITLSGVARFRRVSEATALTPYRQCTVDYEPFRADFEPGGDEAQLDRESVLDAFRAFARARGLDVDWQGLDAAPDEILINGLAMMGPFGLSEKQALLEAADLKARAEILLAITQIELAADSVGSPSLQ